MATNIPPHNLGEIVDGLVALVKNKDISDKKLSNIIKGPDFPTGGELIYSRAIEELYQTGKGSITIRGCLLYTSPSPRDLSTSRMPSSA